MRVRAPGDCASLVRTAVVVTWQAKWFWAWQTDTVRDASFLLGVTWFRPAPRAWSVMLFFLVGSLSVQWEHQTPPSSSECYP